MRANSTVTAVFIDGDWFVHAARKPGRDIDYAGLSRAFRTRFGPRVELVFFTTVVPGRKPGPVPVDALRALGFEVETIQARMIGGRAAGSSIDALMTAKGAALAPRFGRLVLVSGDNDLVPLLTVLRVREVPVILVSVLHACGPALMEAATRVLALQDLLDEVGASAGAGEKAAPPQPADLYIEKGRHLESYRFVRGLFQAAQDSIGVIDPYIDEQVFLLAGVAPPSVALSIVTSRIQATDYPVFVAKLRREGRTVRLYQSREFHDRFLRIDDEWWHSGHSLKDLGSADSRLSRIADRAVRAQLADREVEAIAAASELCPA